MQSEWQQTTVQALVDAGVLAPPIDGNHGEIHPKASDFVASGIPFIMASDLVNGRIDTHGCSFITTTQAKSLRKGFAKQGDVLLSHKATIGRTAIVGELTTDFIVLTPQVTYYRVLDEARLNRHYLKYYFDSQPFQEVLATWAGGGSTRAYLGITAQRKLPIVVPPIKQQLEVVSTLRPLDDRIDLLRQTNATLESIAQALFKSWFVDFDPVRDKQAGREPEGMDAATAALFPAEFEESALGLIPKGWRCGCLGDLLSQRVSRTKPSEITAALPYVPIECITAKSVFLRDSLPGEQAQSSLTRFTEGDILFGAMRPYFHKVCIAPFDGVTRTTAFVLEPKAGQGAFGLFAAFDDSTIEFATTHSEGSTIPYAKWSGSLERKPLVLPPSELADAFEAIVAPLLKAGMQNTRRVQTLTEIRDELLPRLISGKLRLPEAQEQLEDALA